MPKAGPGASSKGGVSTTTKSRTVGERPSREGEESRNQKRSEKELRHTVDGRNPV